VDLVTSINIEIRDNKITMTNNGEGIDVVKHPTYDLWIPEMIFGHLRSSTNYGKEQKITGGKNGFGFKLVLVWSTWGRIETVDAKRELKYTQVFENNLSKINPPKITDCKKKPYTTVEFIPDYARLGMKGLTEQMISLFQRRVYDIAGLTPKEVKVKYNDEPLTVKVSFLFVGSEGTCTKAKSLIEYELSDFFDNYSLYILNYYYYLNFF
jgi:DNA topoisomerase-2